MNAKNINQDISLGSFLIYLLAIIVIVGSIFIAVFIFKFDISKFAENLTPMAAP